MQDINTHNKFITNRYDTMDNKERLAKLKKFQITGTKGEIFKYHKYLLLWIDNVAPLLKYDIQHYDNFLNSARTASTPGLSSRTITQYLNIAKSVVNQAIIELESDITETKPALQTLKEKEEKSYSYWYQNPYGIVILMVIAGLIIYGIQTLITHFFITPS